jgi:putative two-component system response regulator
MKESMNMKPKILIVDDDPDMRESLRKFLTLEGYQTTMAANGLDGLQQAVRERPDFILLDVSMPGIDGYETCNRLKQDTRTAHIPVTFLTYQSDLVERQRGIEVGAADYLSKPVDFDQLSAHLRSHVRVAQQPRQFETPESVIFNLAQTAEARDTYTSGHLRRMEYYSTQLASAAGLKGDELLIVRYGAILHDIGKLRISETILTKPGTLDPDEFATLKRHPEHGAQMISHLRYARQVAPVVLGHHEKWDGTGYPNKLQGDAIPVGARIVAITDAYDAMTTDRPYRRALGLPEAMRRLRARRGMQWDPDLVDLFCSLIEHESLHTMAHEATLMSA